MAEENGDATPGTESEYSEKDKNYSERLEFLDQMMKQNQVEPKNLPKWKIEIRVQQYQTFHCKNGAGKFT